MEFAVIKTGGKQYKVAVGDTIMVEKISDEAKKGDKVVFDQVLLTDDGKETTFGTPMIKGGKVGATVELVGRAKTVIVIKFKQKSRYFKKNGHRQPFTKVKIDSIS